MRGSQPNMSEAHAEAPGAESTAGFLGRLRSMHCGLEISLLSVISFHDFHGILQIKSNNFTFLMGKEGSEVIAEAFLIHLWSGQP